MSVARYRSSWWNGWFVYVGQGQGAMNTRMAEAAVDSLRSAGYEATTFYQLG